MPRINSALRSENIAHTLCANINSLYYIYMNNIYILYIYLYLSISIYVCLMENVKISLCSQWRIKWNNATNNCEIFKRYFALLFLSFVDASPEFCASIKNANWTENTTKKKVGQIFIYRETFVWLAKMIRTTKKIHHFTKYI